MLKLKRINWLLVKSYIGPFIVTFAISIFLLLMEFLWRYIGDLIGKGLEWYVIMEFIFYSIPYLIPNALPLAVLLSTIMTFGNLAERFELAALKSSGASLIRIMQPLIVVMILISCLAFYSANILIPRANLSWGALFYDVTHKKPAMNIMEGIFYNELEGYSIRVGKKHDDNKTIEEVLIYSKLDNRGGIDVIVAKKGKMEFTQNERFMVLTLYEGKRYHEMTESPKYKERYPHNVMSFESYKMAMDLSELELKRSNPELFKDNYNMLNISELQVRIDSMGGMLNDKRLFLQNYLNAYFHFPDSTSDKTYSFEQEQISTPYYLQLDSFVQLVDSADMPVETASTPTRKRNLTQVARSVKVSKDTVIEESSPELAEATNPVIYQQFDRKELIENAKQSHRNLQRIVQTTLADMRRLSERQARYAIEWHKKFTLAFSCILLFFIGAPLGAIIRKGGFGTPMILAILLFIAYFIAQTVGEKLAREQVIEVWSGVWLSSAVFLPFAVFLTYKASTDSRLFDIDAYRNSFRKLFSLFGFKTVEDEPS